MDLTTVVLNSFIYKKERLAMPIELKNEDTSKLVYLATVVLNLFSCKRDYVCL